MSAFGSSDFSFDFGHAVAEVQQRIAIVNATKAANESKVALNVTNGTSAPTGVVYGDEKEFELLQPVAASGISKTGIEHERCEDHDYMTAPLFTRGALLASGLAQSDSQYGLLGQVLFVHTKERASTPEDTRLYMNTNAPLSVLVCGVQGSGKSHTVAAMLESMFIPDDKRIGRLTKPLCGLILHMSDGGLHSNPSEAAWVGVPRGLFIKAPRVAVYVSPSSLNTMRAVYKPLGANVQVLPLYLTEDELDAQAFLSMMAVGSSDSAPLYVQIILSILRELGEHYTYQAFKDNLEKRRKDFNPAQEAGLKQRMSLLESFMPKNKRHGTQTKRFAAGQLTIVDLSDPFIDPASACGIFEVVTRLFVRARVDTGKVIVVDEAHKYLSTNHGSSGLTKSLLTLIREQRHKGMRVIISTQEPTVVPPVLIDLCTVTVLHRFSSPSWYEHILKHVSADLGSDAFDRVVKLQTGEAIVLAPSGLYAYTGAFENTVGQYGRRYLHVRMRGRVTKDGGASILVV
ncbi:hypothetical protein M0805_007292 [Coniferiporia weirii]|nr:hypothetical protein M0805_007292 [Coniferiporia weirii]